MKLCDFLKEDIDVDVSSSLTDEWVIAFVGPIELTEAGATRFGAILENQVKLDGRSHAEIVVDTDKEDNLARTLFYAAAGYCSAANYDRWFKDE